MCMRQVLLGFGLSTDYYCTSIGKKVGQEGTRLRGQVVLCTMSLLRSHMSCCRQHTSRRRGWSLLMWLMVPEQRCMKHMGSSQKVCRPYTYVTDLRIGCHTRQNCFDTRSLTDH